jgi:hypothetical protein
MCRTCVLFVLFALGSSLAGATPYWVEYAPAGGNYPEFEGWTRYTSGGGDVRFFEDGVLVLDGQAGTHDAYSWSRPPGQLDPGPGELFIARWRLCVSHIDPPYPLDPVVGIHSDTRTGLPLDFGYDRVAVKNHYIAYAPGVFHDYEVRSPDMRTYYFYIDDVLVDSGAFYADVGPALVAWGDGGMNAGSLSRWACFSFGVVPEPCTAWLVLGAFLVRLKPRG